MKNNQLIFALVAGLALSIYALWLRPAKGGVVAFAPAALYDTCYQQAARSLVGCYKMSLAGEAVPLHKTHVRKRLERELALYLYSPVQTRAMMVRTRRYFSLIAPILRRNGVPQDFKYVLAAESQGMNGVVSRRGAAGVWQLMPIPAQELGLRIDNQVDERLHPERATEAACRYVKMLYRETGSWTAAMAAYNMGVNGWGRASARVGHGNYYEMAGVLCRETERYVYKVAALKEIMERPAAYGLVQPTHRMGWPDCKRIRVTGAVPSLATFAAAHKTDVATLRELNPWLVGGSLHVPEGKAYHILVNRKPLIHMAVLTGRLLAADSLQTEQVLAGRDSVEVL